MKKLTYKGKPAKVIKQQGNVISHSCISCIYCKCLFGKSGTTFVCLLGQWNGKMATQKTMEKIKTLRCEKYMKYIAHK